MKSKSCSVNLKISDHSSDICSTCWKAPLAVESPGLQPDFKGKLSSASHYSCEVIKKQLMYNQDKENWNSTIALFTTMGFKVKWRTLKSFELVQNYFQIWTIIYSNNKYMPTTFPVICHVS